MRKMVLLALLTLTLQASSELTKAWFAGASVNLQRNTTQYSQSLYSATNANWNLPLSLQGGFSIFTTRIYTAIKYSNDAYTDYSMENIYWDWNVDYTPYLFSLFTLPIHMIAGVGVGTSFTRLYNRSKTVAAYQSAITVNLNQTRIYYKYRIGGALYISNHMSLEGSVQFQNANVIEMPDSATPVTIFLGTKELYLSFNYFF